MGENQSIIENLFYMRYEEKECIAHENDEEINSMDSKIKETLGIDFVNQYQDLIADKSADRQKEAFKEGFKYAVSLLMEANK